VWEFFGGDDAAALRMAIEAHGLLAPRRARMGEGADAAAVEIGAAPLADDDGRYAGHIGWMRPAAAMAPAQQHEPGAAEDAAALSFAVSHDLRAPVRVVEGFARILKEDYGDRLDRVGNDHLERVLSAAARMNQMIDALLFIAKLATQPLVRQPVNLSQLAQYVVDELRRSTPEREARVEIEPGLQASGDPTMLRVALENLLGNAWKYTQRNRDALVSLRGERQGDKRVFVVQDNGTGFDMRSSDRLFGLFQRLHSASEFPGTGVGLASVRRIVRRHGGEIWAESEPGRGATFRFTLGE
jgi:light-regulated signal transduction histidine kinase (bacteriophytochrome)